MAAGGHNTAAAHLQERRDLLVNPGAPAHCKIAANPLLFTYCDQFTQ